MEWPTQDIWRIPVNPQGFRNLCKIEYGYVGMDIGNEVQPMIAVSGEEHSTVNMCAKSEH